MSSSKAEINQTSETKLSEHRQTLQKLLSKQNQDSLEAEFAALETAIAQDIECFPNENKLLSELLREVKDAAAELRSHPKPDIKENKEKKETKNAPTQTPQPSILEIKEKFLRAIKSDDFETVKQLVTSDIFEYLLSQNPNLQKNLCKDIARFSPWETPKKKEILGLLQDKGATPLDPLLTAASLGDLEKIKESKKEFKEVTREVYYLVIYAAANGKVNIIEWLLTQGITDGEISSLFLRVVGCGQLNVVQWFSERYYDLLFKATRNNKEIVFRVSSESQTGVAEFLLSKLPPEQKITYLSQKNHNYYTPLLEAASSGNLEAVKALIKHGANIEDKDQKGNTALLLAVKNGYLNVVEHICTYCPRKNIDLSSALKEAIILGHLAITQWLSARYPSIIYAKDQFDETPLHWAIAHDRLEIFKDLLAKAEEKAPSFSIWKQWDIEIDVTNKAGTPLHWAAQTGALEVVKWLVTKYPQNIDHIDSTGMTPLHRAILKGSIIIVRYLITHGASIYHKNNRGMNALAVAAESYILREIALILIGEFGADPTEIISELGDTELEQEKRSQYLTFYRNYFIKQKNEIYRASLENSLKTEVISDLRNIIFGYLDGTEMTQEEIDNFKIEMDISIEKLVAPLKAHIELGAQKPYKHKALSQQFLRGISAPPCNPLTVRRAVIALFENHPEIKGSEFAGILNNMLEETRHLKESTEKQTPEAKELPLEDTGQQRNALLIAIKSHDVPKAKALLGKYPELYEPDTSRNTPLSYAAAMGQIEILRFLLSHLPKAEIHRKNKDGNTPLLLAVMNSQIEAMYLLLENGANIKDKNRMGMSVFLLIAQNDDHDTAQWVFSSENTGISVQTLIQPLKNHFDSIIPYSHKELSRELYKTISDQKNILTIHRTVDAFLQKHRKTIKISELEKILDKIIEQTSQFCEPKVMLLSDLAGAVGWFGSSPSIIGAPVATHQTTMIAQPVAEKTSKVVPLSSSATSIQ